MPQIRKGRNGGTLKSQAKGDPPINPAGRPKKLPELSDLMNEMFGGEDGGIPDSGTKDIFDGLWKKAKKGDTKAAEIILAYAYGRPKQAHEHTGKDGGPIETKTLIIEIPADGGDE
jgi:hypothetical protein